MELSARLVLGGPVTSVSAGWTHACAVIEPGGRLGVWGRNNYHQCGRQQVEPVANLSNAAELDINVRKVIAGSEHCLCLTGGGRVLAWGWNEHGNCGLAEEDGRETVAGPRPINLNASSGQAADIFTGSAHCFAVIREH